MKACSDMDPEAKHRLLMQMYVQTAEAKVAPVSEYVEDLISGGCKFLVFGHHIFMLDALEAVAVRSKARYIRIDGSVSAAERHRRVKEFQEDEGVRVAVLGLLAAGVGITLTAASTVVFAELHWTPGVIVQAEDRAHRIGQKSSVNVHYLVASGTIDDIIWPCVSRKVEVVSAMCDGRRDHLVAEKTTADHAVEMVGKAAWERASCGDMGDLAVAVAGPAGQAAQTPQESPAHSILAILRGEKAPRAVQKHKPAAAADATAGDDAIESASDSEGDKAEVFSFCISQATGRVHVLDASGQPLGTNFKAADWEAAQDSSGLPEVLRQRPEACRAAEAFLREWTGLRASDQRQLIGQVL